MGLTFDQCSQQNEDEKRLNQFLALLHNEIEFNLKNIDHEIAVSKSCIDQWNFLLRKGIDDNQLISCTKIELDSAIQSWGEYSSIINYSSASDNRIRVDFIFIMPDPELQFFVWEALRVSDSFELLAPGEVIKYGKIYRAFENTNMTAQERKNDYHNILRDNPQKDVYQKIEKIIALLEYSIEGIDSRNYITKLLEGQF